MTTMAPLLRDVIAVLEAAYPPTLAMEWDAVGLVCGHLENRIKRALICVDITPAVVEEARARKSDLIVAHHPLFLKGVHSVRADDPKGQLVHELITSGCALYTAHTNADRASPGVSDALADVLGLQQVRPLQPVMSEARDSWMVLVPVESSKQVQSALFTAGAGSVGNYENCSWSTEGTGQFRPTEGAHPARGEIGRVEYVQETRLEVIAPRSSRAQVLSALRLSHPYEEPAFSVIELAAQPTSLGLGRIGSLEAALPLRDFLKHVAHVVPPTPEGVKSTGDPHSMVQTVAVCGGAGDSLLSTVEKSGADVYVTGDLRHHPVDEHLRAHGTHLVDIGHWASERPWCDQVVTILQTAYSHHVAAEVAMVRPGPWSIHLSTVR